MTSIPRDENRIPVMSALSEDNGTDIVSVTALATTHVLDVDNGVGGIDYGDNISRRDENHVPILMGVSATDGVTPTAVYATSAGALLIRST